MVHKSTIQQNSGGGGSPGGTNGQVQYNNSGAFGGANITYGTDGSGNPQLTSGTGTTNLAGSLLVSGNVGIGTTSPSYTLDVTGASDTPTARLWDGTQGLILGAYTGGGGYGTIYSTGVTPSSANFALASNGIATIINATSAVTLRIDNGVNILLATSGGVAITGTLVAAEILIGTSTDSSNGVLQIAASTSSAAGLVFGNDTSGGQCSIYRSAANTLNTPATFNVGGALNVTGYSTYNSDIQAAAFSSDGTNYWAFKGYSASIPVATGYVQVIINGTNYYLSASTSA